MRDSDESVDSMCFTGGLHAADWSKIRPLVFAVAGDKGLVHIYDLGSTRPMVPAVDLKLPPTSCTNAPVRIASLQFNHKQRDFLACGDALGRVHVWQLSWELSNADPNEIEVFRAYIEHAERQ